MKQYKKHYHAVDLTVNKVDHSMKQFQMRRDVHSSVVARRRDARDARGWKLRGSAKEGFRTTSRQQSVPGNTPMIWAHECEIGECVNTQNRVVDLLRNVWDPANTAAGTPTMPASSSSKSAPATVGAAQSTTDAKPKPNMPAPIGKVNHVNATDPSVSYQDCWTYAMRVVEASRITLLYGPPGTGKSTLGHHLAQRQGVQCINVTLTENTAMDHVRGHFIIDGGNFVWHDGPALMAFRKGGVLILDEIGQASDDVLTFCNNLCDEPEIAKIVLPSGETVEAHKNLRIIGTTNAEPDDLPQALQDRFAVQVLVDRPHPEAINALHDDVQNAARGTCVEKDPDKRVTLRQWKKFCEIRKEIGDELAAHVACGATRRREILNALKLATV